MTKTGEMRTVFDPKRHLTNCLELPARNPEPYYRPDRKKRLAYFDECAVLTRHEGEVEELRKGGVPFYLAEALVLTAYAHTKPTLAKRVAEARKL
jgi:hypothetical protein